MRFGLVGLIALCGCNQILGLSPTEALPPIDAQYFDAPADAPFACPPPGTAPQFSRVLHQIQQDCTDFTTGAGWAVAYCYAGGYQISQGPPDGPFVPIDGFQQGGAQQYTEPRLVPEGDRLVVNARNSQQLVGNIVVYRRGTGDTWTMEHAITVDGALDRGARFGVPSRGPNRRMFFENGDGMYRELEMDDSFAGRLIATYTASDLGIDFALKIPDLSPDGLRIIYSGYLSSRETIFYGDRPTLADRFTVTPLSDVPSGRTPFLTEDCARIYLSAASSVLWVQRQ
jgi:hypothetical protein